MKNPSPPTPLSDFLGFLLGGVLLAMGVFLFFNQVVVGTGACASLRGWGRWGGTGGMLFGAEGQGIGLLMLPLSLGVALLFTLRRQRWGWFLILSSLGALAAAVLQNLSACFQPTSLWNLIVMMALIGSGAGLMFRAIRAYDDADSGD